MCTAIGLSMGDRYFGRNLDLECHFGECVTLTPRGFSFSLRAGGQLETRYALLGMATSAGEFPLYAEAISEAGLGMAGLNFVGNAAFLGGRAAESTGVAVFELIPWLLGQAESLEEAEELLRKVTVLSIAPRPDLPTAELHWFLTDGEDSLVLECTREGMRVYQNPTGVLTNNPPFPYQLARWNAMPQPQPKPPLDPALLGFCTESYGRDGDLLPGGYSSEARFLRAAWLRERVKPCDERETARVAAAFSILSSVAPPYGCVVGANGRMHYTLYSVVANLSRGRLYLRDTRGTEITSYGFSDTPSSLKS